jgi:membrane fusion protein, multidrug efflux system
MNITALSSHWLIGHKEASTGKPPFLGTRGARWLVIVGIVLLLLAVLAGVLPRLAQHRVATADTKQLAVPNVSVVSPITGPSADGLMLPAEVKPWQEASIFSRVNGYLKSWSVDIGAHVEQDQPLAEIDTPDLDHQLEQARSQAALAQRSYDLAKITNEKWQKLWHEGVVSELDAQNTATAEATNKANADAFAANLRVLEQQVAFKRVTAPFP